MAKSLVSRLSPRFPTLALVRFTEPAHICVKPVVVLAAALVAEQLGAHFENGQDLVEDFRVVRFGSTRSRQDKSSNARPIELRRGIDAVLASQPGAHLCYPILSALVLEQLRTTIEKDVIRRYPKRDAGVGEFGVSRDGSYANAANLPPTIRPSSLRSAIRFDAEPVADRAHVNARTRRNAALSAKALYCLLDLLLPPGTDSDTRKVFRHIAQDNATRGPDDRGLSTRDDTACHAPYTTRQEPREMQDATLPDTTPAKRSIVFDPNALRFTTAGAAWYLGRAPITLRKWRVLGKGPRCWCQNGDAMYERDELDRYIAQHPTCRSTSERTLAGAAA